MTRVTLIVFPGGFNWPLWVARERGLFAQHGIDVDVTTTPGSVHQWSTLADGRSQIAITLMDNVVAYREGQGEQADIVVPDAVAAMGFDTRVMPSLVTTPDIGSYADLAGRTLAVDALMTGNALVLTGMLERGGLQRGDYYLVRAGGVMQRFEALKRHEYAGALFNSPFETQLQALGFNVIDTASSLLTRFQGHVVAVRKGWAESNRPAVVSVMRALAGALEWLYEPANRGEAFAIYDRNVAGATASAAASAYAVLFDAATGFPKNGELDIDGIVQVLALRAKYGQPKKTLRDAAAYFDATFLAEALAYH